MKEIIEKLKILNKTIATMESCTGGGVVNYITNVPGASAVLKFSSVTYSNEYKIKMGVSKDTINKYSVYSMEVAQEMSKIISNFADSDYGIGITGKLNRGDENNPYGDDNTVFISIYDRENNKYINEILRVFNKTREENKDQVISIIIEMLRALV